MLPNIVRAVPGEPFRLELFFDDGTSGVVDLATLIPFRGVFAPLADPQFFASVRVDSEAGTVVWPNGADLDPLVLHSLVTGRPIEIEPASLPSSSRRAVRRPVAVPIARVRKRA